MTGHYITFDYEDFQTKQITQLEIRPSDDSVGTTAGTGGNTYVVSGNFLVSDKTSDELEAIAACTIGGVSANGGVGRVSGILVGVLVFEALKICLQFLGVDPAYTYIAQGLVIIVAVALDLRKYLAKK